MLRSFLAYFGAGLPIFAAFVVLLGAVFAWQTWGPHTPSPKENWNSIESQWKPKVEVDLAKVGASTNDFTAMQAAYKSLHDDIDSWVKQVDSVGAAWADAKATQTVQQQILQDAGQFVTAGNAYVAELAVVNAKGSASEVLAEAATLKADHDAFYAAWLTCWQDFNGTGIPSFAPSIALPSGSLAPSASPGASTSPAASPS
jgi:hypothetical protein